MGNPVAHSKSPRIHAAFAAQTGQSLEYRAILVEPGGFDAALDEFQRDGGDGLNVTVPFKADAWRAVSERTPRAQRCGAVNTIWFGEGGRRFGDTTDGIGLVRDLRRNGVLLAGRRVLILGAGGAVAGVLGEMLDERPQSLTLVNRTIGKADDLRRRFADVSCAISVGPYESLGSERFDVVINGTSLSLQGRLPPLPERGLLNEGACCYDMVYGDRATPFVEWAAGHRVVRALDGLGMLVEQAAESFFIWRGVRPETEPVIRMLRRS
ncbi:MAG: shikimate dehydrogenase [Gammaproteobacteria bacterium]|nr:shikimate dehydrogenase [Gammaproteobacteria bacterium]